MTIIENKFYSFQISSYAFDNVENIKLKEKFPNLKTTMRIGLIECFKNDLLDGWSFLWNSFTTDAKKEGLIAITGLTFDFKDF